MVGRVEGGVGGVGDGLDAAVLVLVLEPCAVQDGVLEAEAAPDP